MLSKASKWKRYLIQAWWLRAVALAAITSTLSLALAAQADDQPGLPGNYTKEGTSVYLFLSSSFAFVLHTPGEHRPRVGSYTIDGNTLTLTEGAAGQFMLFTIQGDKLYDQDGTAWVKQVDAPAPEASAIPAQGGQQSGFSGDYQLAGYHLVLFADGSFKQVRPDGAGGAVGQFTVNGDGLALFALGSDAPSTWKIQGDKLLSSEQSVWVRIGDANVPAIAAPIAQQPAFSGEYLQPGKEQGKGIHWAYFPDGSFQATIPGGSGLRGQFQVDGSSLVYTSPMAIAGEQDSIQGDRLIPSKDPSAFAVRIGDAPPLQASAEAPVSTSAPAPMPAIAPPPPPADAPPPTIALGQTMDQVTAGFGQPLRVAKLGAKVIFYYKDMKVTFTNGKVSNVE
jgi:hypothetical protein